MSHVRTIGLALAAVVLGILLGLLDTRPGWNDTGISAGSLLLAGAILGWLSPAQAWLWALALGMWIPALNIAIYHNYGSVLALAFSFAGAYAGALARKALLTMDDRP